MDAVETATAGVARLYKLGEVPPSPEYPYGAYSAVLGRGDSRTLDGAEGMRWGRIVIQTFGRTADAAIAKAEDARDALVGTRLAVTGYETTPVGGELDPSVVRDPADTGVVSVTQTLTFTATKEA